jgi:hypothetical protein
MPALGMRLRATAFCRDKPEPRWGDEIERRHRSSAETPVPRPMKPSCPWSLQRDPTVPSNVERRRPAPGEDPGGVPAYPTSGGIERVTLPTPVRAALSPVRRLP